jgi:hypothetical protein
MNCWAACSTRMDGIVATDVALVAQSARATPQSRHGQESWGIEMFYALQLRKHDYTRTREGGSLPVVPSGVLKLPGPLEPARCVSFALEATLKKYQASHNYLKRSP